ncbi:phage head closure protein [Paracidovorax cattleyae]|uniref:phage head closure protein n=1 Tax=Paracidovorax cattleyae TaxID=80868 RepID=UPI0018AFF516|nr:phage head closure protein [Paracidovorax cattleyae]MBF9263932.1 phage head closure protein [Paracidovorax cattleyae]
MHSQAYNRRISIQRRGEASDSWGTTVPGPENWVEVGKAWASIEMLSGLAALKADAHTSTVKASIRVRWRTDLAPGMRVLHGSTIYDVQAALPDAVGCQHVDLVCEVRR